MFKRLKNLFSNPRPESGSDVGAGVGAPASVPEPHMCTSHRQRGNALLRDGRLEEAAVCYGQAVALDPQDSDAFISLGYVCSELGFFDKADDALKKAIALNPESHDGYYLRGTTLESRGDIEGAMGCFGHALELKPDFDFCRRDLGRVLFKCGKITEARSVVERGLTLNPLFADFHYYRGNLHAHDKEFDAAAASFRTALALQPEYAEVHYGLGNVLLQQGDLDAAILHYRKAISFKPEHFESHSNLGVALKRQGDIGAALESCEKARLLGTNDAGLLNDLGTAFATLGKPGAAIDCFQKAMGLDPANVLAHSNLGSALAEQGYIDAAIEILSRAVATNPDVAELHNNLGTAQLSKDLDAALESFGKVFALKPDCEDAFGNFLFALNYHPDKTAEDIFSAYRAYDDRFGRPHRAAWRAHANSRDPARRLKIGYVSPDFYTHSVRHFLEPLLANHDKTRVEVFAYAELLREDATTVRYKSYADHWIPTLGLSDDALAERIRNDGIDILIDVAGHTARNRLQTFARKPAPVSVSWLGFGYTTGLAAIDYFLTDAASAPPGSEHLFSETPWRLATPCYVYRPAEGMGPVSPPPATARGYVTFGTLTRAVRINHRTTRVWAEILKQVAGARLVVDSGSYRDPAMQASLAARFAAHGIARDRLEIGCHSPPWDVLRGLDIGLDCFPHNSGATLFETLYMGVPFLTLAGRPGVGCLGSSILTGLGHPEWIARTEDGYIEKAVTLASDHAKLAARRNTLRTELQNGPLMDEAGFARRVESAYREMWLRWTSGTS